MARPSDSTKRRRPATGPVALLAAMLVLLLLPASALAGAAVDEYSLGTVGGNDTGREADVQRPPDSSATAEQQLGVVGENVPSQSPLAAAGASAWIGLGAIALAGAVAFAWRRPLGGGAEA
jgi:hypothetical protein